MSTRLEFGQKLKDRGATAEQIKQGFDLYRQSNGAFDDEIAETPIFTLSDEAIQEAKDNFKIVMPEGSDADFDKNLVRLNYEQQDSLTYEDEDALRERMVADIGMDDFTTGAKELRSINTLQSAVVPKELEQDFIDTFPEYKPEDYKDPYERQANAGDTAKTLAVSIEKIGSDLAATTFDMSTKPYYIKPKKGFWGGLSNFIESESARKSGYMPQYEPITDEDYESRAKAHDQVKEMTQFLPEEWRDSTTRVMNDVADEDIPFVELAFKNVAVNGGNLLAGFNPWVGVPAMISSESENILERMRGLGLSHKESEEWAKLYGAISGSIEYVENAGKLTGALLKKPKEFARKKAWQTAGNMLLHAGINVGEELTQSALEIKIVNHVIAIHNKENPDNLIEPVDTMTWGSAWQTARGSLAMSSLLDTAGLSVQGVKTTKDVVKVKKYKKALIKEIPVSEAERKLIAKDLDAVKTPEQFKEWLRDIDELDIDLVDVKHISKGYTAKELMAAYLSVEGNNYDTFGYDHNLINSILEFEKSWDGKQKDSSKDWSQYADDTELQIIGEEIVDAWTNGGTLDGEVYSVNFQPFTTGQFDALGETRKDLIAALKLADPYKGNLLMGAVNNEEGARSKWNNEAKTESVKRDIESGKDVSSNDAEAVEEAEALDDDEIVVQRNFIRRTGKVAKGAMVKSWAGVIEGIAHVSKPIALKVQRMLMNEKTYYNDFFKEPDKKNTGLDQRRSRSNFRSLKLLSDRINYLESKGKDKGLIKAYNEALVELYSAEDKVVSPSKVSAIIAELRADGHSDSTIKSITETLNSERGAEFVAFGKMAKAIKALALVDKPTRNILAKQAIIKMGLPDNLSKKEKRKLKEVSKDVALDLTAVVTSGLFKTPMVLSSRTKDIINDGGFLKPKLKDEFKDVYLDELKERKNKKLLVEDLKYFETLGESLESRLRTASKIKARKEFFNTTADISRIGEVDQIEILDVGQENYSDIAEFDHLNRDEFQWVTYQINRTLNSGGGGSGFAFYKSLVLPVVSQITTVIKQFGDISKTVHKVGQIRRAGMNPISAYVGALGNVIGDTLLSFFDQAINLDIVSNWNFNENEKDLILDETEIGYGVFDPDLTVAEDMTSWKSYITSQLENFKSNPGVVKTIKRAWSEYSMMFVRKADMAGKSVLLKQSIKELRKLNDDQLVVVLTEILRGDSDLAIKTVDKLRDKTLDQDTRLTMYNIINQLHPLSVFDKAALFRNYPALGLFKTFTSKQTSILFEMLSKPYSDSKLYQDSSKGLFIATINKEKAIEKLKQDINNSNDYGEIEGLNVNLKTALLELGALKRKRDYASRKAYEKHAEFVTALGTYLTFYALLDTSIEIGIAKLKSLNDDEDDDDEITPEYVAKKIGINFINSLIPLMSIGSAIEYDRGGDAVSVVFEDLMGLPVPLKNTSKVLTKIARDAVDPDKEVDLGELKDITKDIPAFGTVIYEFIETLENS